MVYKYCCRKRLARPVLLSFCGAQFCYTSCKPLLLVMLLMDSITGMILQYWIQTE